MIKLYYTTTAGEDTEKRKASTSLGGYKSSTEVPNATEGNLFGEITNYTISKDKPSYIAIVLKNESTNQNAENVFLWFDYPENNYSIYKVAAVDMVDDGNGILTMPNTQTQETKPYYADFYEADGEVNKVDLGTINAGEQIGLWIERTIDKDSVDSILDNSIEYNNETELWQTNELAKKEEIEVQIDFDLIIPAP